MNCGCIILAGGQSSRMGQEKGLVLFRGKPMVQWILEAAKVVCEDVVLVANDPRYKEFGVPVFPDEITGKGPLAGLMSGLKRSKQERNLVLSCDVPQVDPQLLHFLISKSEGHVVTIVEAEGQLHPLVGMYEKSVLQVIEDALAQDHLKLRNVIFSLSPQVLDLPKEMPGFNPNWLQNFNTMEELRQAEHRQVNPKMMHVKIRYFGMIAERMGGSEGWIDIPGDGQNCNIREILLESHPVLAQMAWKVAVDQTLVHGLCNLSASSEIVLLPPYAGG